MKFFTEIVRGGGVDPEDVKRRFNSQYRAIEIRVRLLGAYHDRRIELIYEGVRNYSLETSPKFKSPPTYKTGHGDWLIDEIRLSERNLVIHGIEFSSGSRWLIECENIQYHSEPIL